MGTTRRDPKGDRRTGPPLQPLAIGPNSVSDPNGPSDSNALEQTFARTGELIAAVLQLGHGYFKMNRNSLGPDAHLVYTWTLGQYAGCYVYVRVPWYQIGYGLEVLHRKIAAVDLGQLRPTWDSRRTDPS